MSAEDTSLSDDFAREKVPQTNTSSGFHLALIIVGGTIGFSIFLISAQIGGSLGYTGAAFAFAIGCFVLGTMGAITSYVGARSRYSTYLLTEFAFGRTGAKVTNLAIALSLIGWYGVISNFLGQAATVMLAEQFDLVVSPYISVVVASTLMIAVTAYGFEGIDKLALVLVPFMVLFILYAAYASINASQGTEVLDIAQPFTLATAISAVIGSYIAGVIIQPDYSRFAVNNRHAIWSVFIALGIIFPLIMFFSAIPSIEAGQPDLLKVMTALGIILPAFLLLVLGSWSSNVLCLYSSGLSIATILTKLRLTHIIIAIGIVGTAIAFVPAQSYLIDFLVLLGVVIPPIGAIYCIEAIFVRRFDMDVVALDGEKAVNLSAMTAWILATVFGYLSQTGIIGLFYVASIDALIVSGLVYGSITFFKQNKTSSI